MEEFYFTCEICGKKFPADPNTMLECNMEFEVVDDETGEVLSINEEIKNQILKEAKSDPEIAPFLKGAICICIECQEKFESDSSEIPEEE